MKEMGNESISFTCRKDRGEWGRMKGESTHDMLGHVGCEVGARRWTIGQVAQEREAETDWGERMEKNEKARVSQLCSDSTASSAGVI